MNLLLRVQLSKHPVSFLGLSLAVAMFGSSVNATGIEGFSVTPLETPEGFIGGTAYDLNDHGVAVGTSRNSDDHVGRAMFWGSDGIGFELLGHGGSSDNNGVALAISNSGQVVGRADGPATIWLDGIDSAGTDLYLKLGSAKLKDINESGFSVANEKLLNSDLEVISLSGIYQELGSLRSTTTAINNNNTIIGTIGIPKSEYNSIPVIKPILLKDNSFKLLGTLPELEGGDAKPLDINDNDQVVGVSFEESSSIYGRSSRAVIWQNDLISDIGSFGGDRSSAVKINNLGQIIGNSLDSNNQGHAFLWQDDVMYDLSPVFCDAPSECTTFARAINNNNEIVATVFEPSGNKLLKVSFEDAALSQLPSFYTPLNFISPAGGGITGENNVEGADISVSLDAYVVRHRSGVNLKKREKLVSYHSTFTNSGSKVASNLVSKFSVSGKLSLLKVYTNRGSCKTEVNGSDRNRSINVTCQHGELNPDQIITRTVEVKAKRLRILNAIDTVETNSTDPDTSNNSVRVKGIN